MTLTWEVAFFIPKGIEIKKWKMSAYNNNYCPNVQINNWIIYIFWPNFHNLAWNICQFEFFWLLKSINFEIWSLVINTYTNLKCCSHSNPSASAKFNPLVNLCCARDCLVHMSILSYFPGHYVWAGCQRIPKILKSRLECDLFLNQKLQSWKEYWMSELFLN